MKNLFNNLSLKEKEAILEQHKGIKFPISEQSQGAVQAVRDLQTTTSTPQQPLMNETAVKSCLDATYGKNRGIGKTPKGGLIYNLAGLVTVFYLNGRYLAEYTKTKGNFNCSSGRAVLTPDSQVSNSTTQQPTTQPTKPTAQPAKPTAQPAKPSSQPIRPK